MQVVTAIKAYLSGITRKEPAVVIGGFLTIVSAIATQLNASPDIHTWQAAIPVIVAVIIRQFVYSPQTVYTKVDSARAQGQIDAINIADAQRKQAAIKAAQTRKQKQLDQSLIAKTQAAKASKPKRATKKSTSRKNASGD